MPLGMIGEARAHIERTILPLIAAGEIEEARRDLYELAGAGRDISSIAPLIVEAEDLLRAGLIAEAEHRLNLFLRPKFSSLAACQRAYDAAMKETRANPKGIAP